MKPIRCLPILFALVCAAGVHAQDTRDYTLNDGHVHFHVPAGWAAIMEKHDGNPQAIAFEVPDPSAKGSEDSATVTVKTRQLSGATTFTQAVQEEFDRAKAQTGYASDPSATDASAHQYFVVRGKTKYLVRDSFLLSGTVVAHVRCQRPLLDKTPSAWNSDFDNACNRVVASLKQ